jgi:hypothetical protein
MIWVDIESGTYGGDHRNIKFIDASNWNDEDWDVFDNWNDSDRSCYAAVACGGHEHTSSYVTSTPRNFEVIELDFI